jgi:hypothetical protein
MNEAQTSDFDKFETLISPWKEGFQLAVYSYLCIKSETQSNLLFGRIVLATSKSSLQAPRVRFESERALAGRESIAIGAADIDGILARAKKGLLQVLNEEMLLPMSTGRGLATYFAPIYHPSVSEGPRLPSLLVRGNSISDLLGPSAYTKPIDWELKAADQPFDSLDDLLATCGLPSRTQMGDSTTLEIAAHAPGRITPKSIIQNEEASIECLVAQTLDKTKIRIGYKIFRGEQVERGKIDGDVLTWQKAEDTLLGSCKIKVGDAALVQSFFSYADVAFHQWWLTDPKKLLNLRLAVHDTFDDTQEFLKKMLFKPEQDNGFEWAISSLFNLLGFASSNYGRIPKLQDGPDVIAITPAGHIGVIECTIGLLDQKDKLAKLVQRTTLIREKLAAVKQGHLHVQPLIVSALTKAEVSAHLDAAAKHGIAVMCKEDIEEFLKKVALVPKPEAIFQELKRLIPEAGTSFK